MSHSRKHHHEESDTAVAEPPVAEAPVKDTKKQPTEAQALEGLAAMVQSPPDHDLANAIRQASQSGVGLKGIFDLIVKHGGDIKALIGAIEALINRTKAKSA